ncbi:MAG TPA: methylmalonyl-CoA mutase [Candidatus Thalassarchaeaceae archaeon]|nr:methylmalonyl-CoA mutase [Euryarchaeota archaeon]DAC43505.1 MAG TPA: methylmalonyl-CoA mutase [Candidatus Poseidoniales archaeon]HII35009.1 methylmalonyl-CoA mutase [Candidatus Thalassarchaeaceae archaeon]|tara:strand:+ start:3708 stop:5240 length:1533 start_codon:yes stop_codon:yes gene_type:complete
MIRIVSGDLLMNDESEPGKPPYTRGIYPDMYKTRLWTMRQYAGFSTAKQTNERFRLLLEHGQTGLSVAFDLPTQLGLDSDHPRSLGEVGKVGVPIDSISDMRELFDGIDLSSVSTSMTINAPATTLLALYVAIADEQGVDRKELRGTVQNDILKEYIARGLYIYPPEASMRLTSDLMKWCSTNAPSWNTVSVSGYHMREAGCTAVEEVALTILNGMEYVKHAIEAGMSVDDFAPRISFFFACQNNILEEVSKFRAARKIWYELMTSRFKPRNPKSAMLRFHTQTAGASLTAQQPFNNIVRVSYQALSSVLGGTQSLHTNSYDEAIGLPTDEAVTIALRTQQILASETGIVNHIDPLAGSYVIEEMTSQIIKNSLELIESIESTGGALSGIRSGVQQRMIHESAWKHLNSIEEGTMRVIGVNVNQQDEDPIEGQILDPLLAKNQVLSLSKMRLERDEGMAKASLQKLSKACQTDQNLMDFIIDAVRCYCTVGEINQVLCDSFGTWVSPSGV